MNCVSCSRYLRYLTVILRYLSSGQSDLTLRDTLHLTLYFLIKWWKSIFIIVGPSQNSYPLRGRNFPLLSSRHCSNTEYTTTTKLLNESGWIPNRRKGSLNRRPVTIDVFDMPLFTIGSPRVFSVLYLPRDLRTERKERYFWHKLCSLSSTRPEPSKVPVSPSDSRSSRGEVFSLMSLRSPRNLYVRFSRLRGVDYRDVRIFPLRTSQTDINQQLCTFIFG